MQGGPIAQVMMTSTMTIVVVMMMMLIMIVLCVNILLLRVHLTLETVARLLLRGIFFSETSSVEGKARQWKAVHCFLKMQNMVSQ